MSAEIVAVRVDIGSGCACCVYNDTHTGDCHFPKVEQRQCSASENMDGFERIYVTPEKAALMRLRGEVK